MPDEPFQYAVLRVVPCIEREEFLNVGVILFCRTRDFLAARVELDEARLASMAPGPPLGAIREHLEDLRAVASGRPEAGPIARLPASERFHWLVAPSSTAVQTSSVHTGLTEDPETALDHLMNRLVRRPGRATRS
jgi:hypothetical protein